LLSDFNDLQGSLSSGGDGWGARASASDTFGRSDWYPL
jgi:hypothetical protein